jgi:hypothetical protein
MASDKRKAYHSYLIRCWVSAPPALGDDVRRRFVVESIAERQQRWGFDSFADMVAFLEVALLQEGLEERDGTPPSDTG